MTTGSTIEEVGLDERLVETATAGLELMSIYLGRELGLYEALSEARTFDQLAAAAGIDQRYAREWLEQQATAGLVNVDDPDSPAHERVFSLPARHRDVLVDVDSPFHVGPIVEMVVGISHVIDAVATAYRTGEGVPYAEYGSTFRQGQGGINRPAFVNDLVDPWLVESVPEVVARLEGGGRVADLGCGVGWSTLALARAFPEASVVGIDSDEASIIDARANAASSPVSPTFVTADAATLGDDGPFDLVLLLEALHDLAQPVEILRQARSALAVDGALVVADEKVADTFQPNGDVIERMMFGWSVLHCLPAARAEENSAAIGTVLREGVLRQMALSAGFSTVETPDVDAGFFRIYVLRP